MAPGPHRLALPLRAVALVGVLALVVSVAQWWSGRGDGRTHLVVPELDGDGLLIKDAGGQVALVDGGADGSAVATWLGGELPLGRRHVDLLLLTRADQTTLPGLLAIARRYQVRRAILAEPAAGDPLWDGLVETLRGARTRVEIPRDRLRVQLGAGRRGSVELDIRPVGSGRLVVEVRAGKDSVLLLHSLGSSPIPAGLGGGQVAAIVFPWQRPPDELIAARIEPRAIIFGEERRRDPQLTLWDRRVGSALLLHEHLHGRIDLSFDAGGMQVAVARSRKD